MNINKLVFKPTLSPQRLLILEENGLIGGATDGAGRAPQRRAHYAAETMADFGSAGGRDAARSLPPGRPSQKPKAFQGEARASHVPFGTWFSPPQKEQLERHNQERRV